MQIILEEKDQKYIDCINEDLANNEEIPLFINEKGKVYVLEFEAVDIAKANAFASEFLNPNINKQKYLEENFGIRIKALNYDRSSTCKRDLKNYLRNMLDELERMG